MRLIDADELKEIAHEMIQEDPDAFNGGYAYDAVTVDEIDEAPTIEAVPVAHEYDLISRSALFEEVKSLTVTVMGLRAGKGVLHEYAKQYRDTLLRIINEQPTIEAVPVVYGEWIRNENPIEISCECSICHAKDYWYDIDKANEYYWFHRKFCPNCGAMMKGGAE